MAKKTSLWEKVKNIGRAGLLIPSLILGQGCIGDTVQLGTEWREEKEIVKEPGEIKMKRTDEKIENYFIQAKQKEANQIEINTKKQTERIYNVAQEIDFFKTERKYRIYTIEEYDKESKVTKASVGIGLAGLIMMLEEDKDSPLKSLGGVMMCVGIVIGSSSGTPKKHIDATDKVRFIPLSTDYEILRKEKQPGAIQSPGEFVPVGISPQEFSFFGGTREMSTNPDGHTIVKLEERVSGWAFTKKNLEEELEKSSFVQQQVSQSYQKEFSSLLAKYSYRNIRRIKLTTRAKHKFGDEIHNSSTEVSLKGYSVDNNSIEKALKEFVNKYINPQLKEKAILVRDKVSHARINHAMIEMQISGAPKKEDLAKPYFKGGLKEKSLRYIRDYLGSRGEREILYTDNLGLLKAGIYQGTKADMEVTHPAYHFLRIEGMNFTNPVSILDMNDKGEKIRKKDVEE